MTRCGRPKGRWSIVIACACALALSLVALPGSAWAQSRFRRGDTNGDGYFDISDPINLLSYLYLGTGRLTCEDSGDVNDEGFLDVSDPIYLLSYLYLGSEAPAAPFPVCGPDESEDALACVSYPEDACARNLEPSARCIVTPGFAIAPTDVSCDATGSEDIDGTIVEYSWDFGDGTRGSGVQVEHRYETAGEFTICLTVTDDEGGTGSARETVGIHRIDGDTPEEEVVILTNRARIEIGLPPLQRNLRLEEAIEKHLEDVAVNNLFPAPDSPVDPLVAHNGSDGSTSGDRVRRVEYYEQGAEDGMWGENLAVGYPSAAVVVPAWLDGKHWINISKAKYREMGAGYVEGLATSYYPTYWGQLFGARSSYRPVVINAEEPVTDSREVTLYLHGMDWDYNPATEVYDRVDWAEEMRVSNDTDLSGASWVPYRDVVTWVLEPGNGEKTVHVQMRKGERVFSAQDSIFLVE